MNVDKGYLQQLEKYYPAYLRNVITGQGFEPLILRGGKNKPDTTVALHRQVQQFQQFQKTPGRPGWHIEWGPWSSKKLGRQQWPVQIRVDTEADYLFLLQKKPEVLLFKKQVAELLQWQPSLVSWLSARPQVVLNYQTSWKNIITVTDYLMQHPVQGHYQRSLPVPVHTKFIEQHQAILLSLLQFLVPERLQAGAITLEQALNLQRKPFLFPMRWLDKELFKNTSGMEVSGITAGCLRQMQWTVNEIWLVENETNLYLLPERKSALALFAKGYALEMLNGIPLLQQSRLIYWGDLDEDGFVLLNRMRQLYPHTESILMDEATVLQHLTEISLQPRKYKGRISELLKDQERAACSLLMKVNGRIEQEQLNQLYIQESVRKI